MIRNIVFDIGNVLLAFQPKQYFTKMFNDETFASEMCQLMMSSQIWKDYDLGLLDLTQVKEAFQKEVPQYHALIEQMLAVWVEILKPKHYTLNKLKQLKQQGYQVYLLSNLNKEAYDYIREQYCLFDEVDGYIVSFAEQLAKPDEKIYALLCERYSLKPEQCLFLDDLKENVDAAIRFGMHAIHFECEEVVEKQLQKVLVEQVC